MLGEIHDWLVGHREHDWKFDGLVHHTSKMMLNSACPATAKRYKCRCGLTHFELTPAGFQQLQAGDVFEELIGNWK